MTVVSVGTEVDAPPERVWEVVADPQNLPRWERHIAAVRDVPEGGLRAGSTYQTELEFMGAKARVTASVHTLISAAGPIGFVAAGLLLHQTGSVTAGFVLVAAAFTAGAAIIAAGGRVRRAPSPSEPVDATAAGG